MVSFVLVLTGCTAAGDPNLDGGSGSGTATPTVDAEPEAPAGPTRPQPDPSLPPPDEHSAVGALPDGFPADLLPVPAGGEILVATYAPDADAGPQQPYSLSLNVRTSATVDEVLALYRSSLVAAGFAESSGGAGGSLHAESTFSRSAGQEILVVGVLDRDGVRTVTVGGRVRSGA